MSTETAETWPVLSALEQRILGVLIEKQMTAPDTYPMSVNALMSGCNQKSNPDPVMNVDETDVEATLAGLHNKGLVIKITFPGRVDRWRVYPRDRWGVNKLQLALLAELLLRGAQTEGELLARTSRMEPLDDLEQLRRAWRPLVDRKLVVTLMQEEGRGMLLAHGFYTSDELEVLGNNRERAEEGASRIIAATDSSPTAASHARRDQTPQAIGGATWADWWLAALQEQMAYARQEIERLNARLKHTEETVEDLRNQLETLKGSLGE